MKILTIIFIIFSMETRASNEISNLMPRSIWQIYCPLDDLCSFKTVQVLPVETDNIFMVNGREYNNVMISPYPAFWDYYESSDNFQILHYRSDGNRIYRYDDENEKDILMYDFDLSPGDEVKDGDGNRYKVLEIIRVGDLTEHTTLNEDLRVFKLQGLDTPVKDDMWIEKVGSVKFGLLRESDFSDTTDCHLLFFNYYSVNPVIAFALNYDNFKSMPFKKSFPYKESFYTEEQEKEIMEWIVHEKMDFEFIRDSLNIKGRSYMHKDPFDIMECFINGTTINVDIQQVHGLGDIVANDMTNYGYDVKIPGFKPGTYDIIYYEDNQKKDTTITCLGSVTVIENVQENSFLMHSNPIYDLSGRRLKQLPERGIYIQNGKVIFR